MSVQEKNATTARDNYNNIHCSLAVAIRYRFYVFLRAIYIFAFGVNKGFPNSL
jgi:hypothetical protein